MGQAIIMHRLFYPVQHFHSPIEYCFNYQIALAVVEGRMDKRPSANRIFGPNSEPRQFSRQVRISGLKFAKRSLSLLVGSGRVGNWSHEVNPSTPTISCVSNPPSPSQLQSPRITIMLLVMRCNRQLNTAEYWMSPSNTSQTGMPFPQSYWVAPGLRLGALMSWCRG